MPRKIGILGGLSLESTCAMAASLRALHRAGADSDAISASKIRKVGLLGSIFTMREHFFRDPLERAGIEVLVPEVPDQRRMNVTSRCSTPPHCTRGARWNTRLRTAATAIRRTAFFRRRKAHAS